MTKRRLQKIIFSTIALLVISVSAWLQSRLQEATPVQPGFYRITQFYDGDTFAVDMNGVEEKVRLIGIDTPETHKPNAPVQCFGPEASEFSKQLLVAKTVRLEADPKDDNRDRYGRLLRYAYLEDGTLVNQKIITEGFGFAYTSFPFTKKNDFVGAQIEARNAKRGLWASCEVTNKSGRFQTNDIE